MPKRHGDNAPPDPLADQRRRFDGTLGASQFDNLIRCDADLLCGVRMNLGPAIPNELSDRLGNFLEPWLVGAASVGEKRMRICIKHELGNFRRVWSALQCRGFQRDLRSGGRGEKSAFGQRLDPEIVRIGAAAEFRPLCFDRIGSVFPW